MPAPSSSSIPAAFTQLDGAEALGDADVPHLLAYLAAIRDPRAPSGRRHPLIAILAMAAAAVLTGARSFAAIAEWAADAPQPVRAALGARREAPGHLAVPSEATIRRSLARLDAEVLARVIGAWLADHGVPTSGDGRSRWTARRCGAHARRPAGPSAFGHGARQPRVLAQHQVDGAPARCPGCGHCWPAWS